MNRMQLHTGVSMGYIERVPGNSTVNLVAMKPYNQLGIYDCGLH